MLTPDIERVEVLRGPQSGLYGSDAIGGVINIITRAGAGPMTVAAGLEAGSFDTFNQAARLSGAQDAFHYSVNVMHFRAGATPVTPLDLLPPGETRNDDYDDNLTLSTKLGYDIAPGVNNAVAPKLPAYATVALSSSATPFTWNDSGANGPLFPQGPGGTDAECGTGLACWGWLASLK